MKEVEIECPCCDSLLLIDVLTRKVLRSTPRRERDASGRPKLSGKDWDSALDRVEGRIGESLDKFDLSLERERNRTKDLDELFSQAEDRLETGDDVEAGDSTD